MTVIKLHLGPSHPIHISIHEIMASLLIPLNKWKEAMFLYKSSMMCSLNCLGPNHIETAQLHLNLGHFYLKWLNKTKSDQKDEVMQIEALSNFEQAYMIFDKNFDQT